MPSAMVEFGSSVRGAPLRASDGDMKKTRPKKSDDLRPEYDFSKLGPGVRGKYYKRVVGRPIVVELRADPEKAKPIKRKRTARRTRTSRAK
jgi:hypothetical protein